MLDQIAEARREREYEACCQCHAQCAIHASGGTEKRAEPEKLNQDEIVHQCCSENDKQQLGHGSQVTFMPGSAPLSTLKRKISFPPEPPARIIPWETPAGKRSFS